jgi:aspartate beta-hydroxylase
MGDLDNDKFAMMSAIQQLDAEASQAIALGRFEDALKAWQKILDIDPNHISALAAIGKYGLRKGDFVSAKRAFQRVIEIDGRDPQQWVNLAIACKALKDDEGEANAIKGALTVDPMDLLALLMRATYYERLGDKNKAAAAFGAVASVAPPMAQLHPDLHQAVEYAISFKTQYNAEFGEFMDTFLRPHFDAIHGENTKRFRDSLDIMVGRKRRYDSQSMLHHYPGLAPIEFFDRDDFPWLDAFEANTQAIKDEFCALHHLFK